MIRDTSLRELRRMDSARKDEIEQLRRALYARKSVTDLPKGWTKQDLAYSGYNDLVMSPGIMKQPASSAPSKVAWLTDLQKWSYSVGDYSFFDGMQLPHSYMPGTDIYPHVHFIPVTAISDTETVVWTINYSGAAVGAVFPATAAVTCTFTNNAATRFSLDPDALSGTDIVADTHLIAGGATIDGTDFGLSSVIDGRLTRAAGTYAGEVLLSSSDSHIRINRLGSQQEYAG